MADLPHLTIPPLTESLYDQEKAEKDKQPHAIIIMWWLYIHHHFHNIHVRAFQETIPTSNGVVSQLLIPRQSAVPLLAYTRSLVKDSSPTRCSSR